MPLPAILPRQILLGAVLAALGVLGGCLPAQNPVGLPNTQIYSRDTHEHVHQFHFIPGSAAYERVELELMDGFLSRNGVSNTQIVSISASGALAAARQTAVFDALASRGVTARVVPDQQAAPDAVLLMVQGRDVLATRCLAGEARPYIDGLTLQRPGCANDENLANMLVDSQDLLHGKELGPSDGAAIALGIQRYRAGEVTPLQENTIGN